MSERLLAAFAFLMLANCTIVAARCVDVVDVATELPDHVVTPNNLGVTYTYNLEKEQYLISWNRGRQGGGPFGPFMLSRGCAPASLRWESTEYLLFAGGCGTFCWYVLALPVAMATEQHQMIERPLAFDPTRNLLAHYPQQDIIRVENLVTGREQDIHTAYECEMASGLCFEAVRFTKTELEYTWRYNPIQRVFSVPLDEELIRPE